MLKQERNRSYQGIFSLSQLVDGNWGEAGMVLHQKMNMFLAGFETMLDRSGVNSVNTGTID